MGQLYRTLLLAAVATSVVYSSVDLEMSSTPPKLDIGLTKDVSITCKASINSTTDADMIFMTSLVISHGSDSLASVSMMSTSGKSIPPFTGLTGAGFNQTGDSYITITIRNVDENDTGTYFCEAVGMDNFNQLERDSVNVSISSHTPDNTTYLKEIVAIEDKLKELNKKLGMLDQRWPHVDSDPLFTRFNYTGGKTYLLSKSALGHVSLSQFVCFVQGGYLAEVNDVDEFEMIRTMLRKELNGTSDVTVWLGSTDQVQEGQWVHQYHPNDPVYKSWSANSGYDCMAMTSRTDFHNEDLDCQEPGRALCELH